MSDSKFVDLGAMQDRITRLETIIVKTLRQFEKEEGVKAQEELDFVPEVGQLLDEYPVEK